METQERMSILSWETTLAATNAEMARFIALIIIFKAAINEIATIVEHFQQF